ncbi:MAG TPA: PII uridylyl-transferase, partial [Alphaproteobacteria bacterium]|nr:PII uridylyl-transferase [Alphaproteobacteria bacterium]
EELLVDEESGPTAHPRIFRAAAPNGMSLAEVEGYLARLRVVVDANDVQGLLQLLCELVESY